MLIKRLLFAGAVAGITVALLLPHSSGDRTVFVISGGDLKRAASFDNDKIGPARGWWWHPETRVPPLTGSRYHLRFHDSASPAVVTEWIYVPDASGALPVTGESRLRDTRRIVWMAFTPAFNSDLIAQIRGGSDFVDGKALSVVLAIGAGVLLILTAVGLRFYAAPLWLLRRATHDAGVAVASDAGPAYLYTSVPRVLWPEMGRLGRAPRPPVLPPTV